MLQHYCNTSLTLLLNYFNTTTTLLQHYFNTTTRLLQHYYNATTTQRCRRLPNFWRSPKFGSFQKIAQNFCAFYKIGQKRPK